MPLPELDQCTINCCTPPLLEKKAQQEKALGPDLEQTPTTTTTMNSDFRTSIVESLVVDHANYRCALQVRSCLDGYQCKISGGSLHLPFLKYSTFLTCRRTQNFAVHDEKSQQVIPIPRRAVPLLLVGIVLSCGH